MFIAERAPGATRALLPPRLRVEWVIANARLALSVGALLAAVTATSSSVIPWALPYLLGYVVYSLGMLALVWAPVRFARGWDVAVYLFDFCAFAFLLPASSGAATPFLIYVVFLLVCAGLRWQTTGMVWTALGVIVANAVVSVSAPGVPVMSGAVLKVFVVRTMHVVVTTVLLWYLTRYQHRFQREIGQLAAWPRTLSADPGVVASEVLEQSAALLGHTRLVLVWADAEETGLNVAWQLNGAFGCIREPAWRLDALVPPSLATKAFQASDASGHGPVLVATPQGLLRRRCRPIDDAFARRFDIHRVQSWPLEGEMVRGRLFCLASGRLRLDDLALGELIAIMAESRLESMVLLGQLHRAAARDERMRVAGDLHDGLLQSQAGAALQLLAARRLLDRDPEEARHRLSDVQAQLERTELEMRAVVEDLHPRAVPLRSAGGPDLAGRLDELRRRIERQWNVAVPLHIRTDLGAVPESIRDDLYRIAQEAVLNAARHAEASEIVVDVSLEEDQMILAIADDGCGFPFLGTFDLPALDTMRQGPVTLKERVARLGGALTLTSTREGSALRVAVPRALVAELAS